MAIVMLALSVTISKILAVEIMTLNGARSNANILIKTLYLTAVVMFAISFTISKPFAVEML